MKYRMLAFFATATICCITASGQNPQIKLLDIDAYIVSVYIKTDGGYCGGSHSFMFIDGEYCRFINNTYNNKYVFADSLYNDKNNIDVTEFDYDEIDARINSDYTHNLYLGEFEFMPKGENVVLSKSGFYENGDTLFAIYKYQGRVLEYTGVPINRIYEDGIDMDCPCDSYTYNPQNLNQNKFILNSATL